MPQPTKSQVVILGKETFGCQNDGWGWGCYFAFSLQSLLSVAFAGYKASSSPLSVSLPTPAIVSLPLFFSFWFKNFWSFRFSPILSDPKYLSFLFLSLFSFSLQAIYLSNVEAVGGRFFFSFKTWELEKIKTHLKIDLKCLIINL